MTTSRVRLTHRYGEVAPNTWGDFNWVHEHEKELLDQYGECVILVYQQRVIGKGETIEEALTQAEDNAPSNLNDITPVTYFLHHRHPFFRVRPNRG